MHGDDRIALLRVLLEHPIILLHGKRGTFRSGYALACPAPGKKPAGGRHSWSNPGL